MSPATPAGMPPTDVRLGAARWIALLMVLASGISLQAAERPPLAEAVRGWAAALGHGAVAAAGRHGGEWSFALAGQPFAPDHAEVPAERVIFEIGSISKVFTGILLARAVVDGELALDDTLAQRLPVRFAHPATGAVSLRQLATHTSCLPRLPDNLASATAENTYAGYDREAMYKYLAAAELDGRPPCDAAYSNLGFGILGVVLERVYGKPWATLVRERITGPLGMVDTVQELSPAQRSRFADSWDRSEPARPWTFQAMAGAGALRSTLADLSKLADALLAGAEGPLGAAWPLLAGDYAAMPAMGGEVGLALIHATQDGEETYFHGGGTGGYRSTLQVWPASGRAVIVLASNAAAVPEAWLAAREASAKVPVQRTEVALPTEVLDGYAGVYAIDPSARFTVLRQGEGLVVRLTAQPFVPVYASARDVFFYRVVDAQLSFHRDADGEVDGLTLHQNGRDIPAARQPGPPPHIELPGATALTEYAGEYEFGGSLPGAVLTVDVQADTLRAQLTGQPAFPVFNTGGDRFEYDVVVASLTFERDADGEVVAVVLHQNGAELRAPRR